MKRQMDDRGSSMTDGGSFYHILSPSSHMEFDFVSTSKFNIVSMATQTEIPMCSGVLWHKRLMCYHLVQLMVRVY